MTQITLFCNPQGNSGFGKHGRELALALIRQGADLKLMGGYKPDMPREFKECFEKKDKRECAIMLTPPYYWSSERRLYKKLYGYGIFEGDRVPTGWAIHSENVDGVIVPSTHTKDSFKNAGVDENKILVVPHGVDKNVYKLEGKKVEKMMKQFPEHFKFLFVGGWAQGENDRKGAQFLLRAFNEEFNKEDKVLLIMKYNTAYCPKEQIMKQTEALGLKDNGLPILQIFDNVNEEELAELYRTADCLVSPHMAESWGMQMSEALACGTPVLATHYGGNTDYMEPHFTGELVEANSDPKYFYEETKWLKPRIKEIRTFMRGMYEGKFPQIKADSSKLITWDESARRIMKIVNEKVS